MKKYKKQIFLLLGSVLLYLGLSFIYQRICVIPNTCEVYMLANPVERGEEIKKQQLEKIQVQQGTTLSNDIFKKEEDIIGKYATQALPKGTVLQSFHLIPREKYVPSHQERISLKITNTDDIGSFQLEKGSIVHIYYTGKTDKVKELQYLLGENYLMGTSNDSYTTVQLLKDVPIFNVYDKFGNEVLNLTQRKNNTAVMDTLMIEVDSSTAMKINQLKKYGSFSISIVR